MTIVASIASKQYTPQTFSTQANIPASVKRLKFTFTRESWPAGVNYTHPNAGVIPNTAMAISATMPDGSPGGGATFAGGNLYTDAGGKRISETLVPGVTDILVPNSYFEFSWYNPQTGVMDLPAGLYTFSAQILVTLNTAITIERF